MHVPRSGAGSRDAILGGCCRLLRTPQSSARKAVKHFVLLSLAGSLVPRSSGGAAGGGLGGAVHTLEPHPPTNRQPDPKALQALVSRPSAGLQKRFWRCCAHPKQCKTKAINPFFSIVCRPLVSRSSAGLREAILEMPRAAQNESQRQTLNHLFHSLFAGAGLPVVGRAAGGDPGDAAHAAGP